MADVYLTKFQFTASGLSKVTSQFTGMANGMKAKAAAAGAAIGKALTGPIAAAMATMVAGMGLIGVTKEYVGFEKAASNAVSRLGLNVNRRADEINADLKRGFDVSPDELKYVKTLENVQGIQRELGATTAWTGTQVGQGIENIAAMGADVSDMTSEGMKPFLDLASATDYALDSTAETMMATLRQFNMYDDKLTQSSRVSDVFASAIGASALDMTKLSTAMGYAGPIFNALGYDIAEAATYGAMFSNAGYDGSMSGTMMRGALVRLLLPTKNTAEAIEGLGKEAGLSNEEMDELSEGLETTESGLKKIGLTLDDVDPTKHSLIEILRKIKDAGATEADIMDIFGMRAGPGVLSIMNTQLDDYERLLKRIDDSEGAAGFMAFQRLDNLWGSLTLAQSALSELAITLADYFIKGPLRNFADWLASTGTPAVKGFLAALKEGDYNAIFQKLGKLAIFAVEQIVAGFLGLGNRIKNIIVGAFSADALKPIVDNFGALIVTSFIVLKTNLIGVLAGLVSTVVSAFISMAAKSVAALAPMVARVAMVFANMARMALTQVVTMAGRVVLAFIGMASKSVASLILMGSQVAATFLGMATTALIHVASLVAGVVTATATMASKVLANVARMAAGVIATFIAMASPILLPLALVAAAIAGIGLAAGAIPGVGKKFKEFGGKAVAALKDVWKSISAGNYSEAFDKIKNYVKKAFESIKSYFKSADLKKDVQKLFDGLKTAFMKGVEVIVEQAKNLGEKLKVALTEAIKSAIGEAKFEELSEKFNEVKDKIIETVESIKEPFEGVWTSLKEKAKSAIEDIKSAFGPAFDEIKQTVEKVKNAISILFDENEGKAQQWISTLSQIIAKFVEWGGSAVIGLVKTQLEFVAKVLETVFKVVNDYILPALGWLYDKLVIIKDMFWLWAGDFIMACWDVAKNASSFKEGIVNIFKLIAAYIIAKVEMMKINMVNEFKGAFNTVVIHAFLFKDDLVTAFNGLYTALQSPVESIKSLITGISTTISNVLDDVSNLGDAVTDKLGIGKAWYTFRSDTGNHSTYFMTEEQAAARKKEVGGTYWVNTEMQNPLGIANQTPVLRTLVPGQDTTIETDESGNQVLVEVEASQVEEAVGEGFANAFTGGAYGIGKGLYNWATSKTINDETAELNTKTLEDFVKNLPADATGEIGVFEDGAGIIADAISNAPPDKTLKVASVETAASSESTAESSESTAESSESTAESSGDTAQYTKQTAVSVKELVDKYGISNDLAKQAIESGRIDEIIPHLKELNQDTFADRLEYWKEYFGLNEKENLDVQDDILKITDENGKTLLELEGLSGKTLEELSEIKADLEEERKESSETEKGTEQNTGETAENTKDLGKESYEKTKDSLEDPRFYSSFFGNSLDYIQRIKELAAVGMAHPKQIAHAAMLSEKISNDLMRAYETLGVIPNEFVASVVGLDTSQLGPVPIDTVAESIDVPKTETVDVNADATVSEESKSLLASEISSVDPTIVTNTDVDQQSLAATVGNIEAQKPNVGVYLYIAQNITVPKTVNIGVNFYPLNSPTANVPSSTDTSLQQFDSGGYTGRYSGPAWVDPEEVILNKAQQLGVIKSLVGNNKGSGEVHVHYDLRNTIITGFKDVDDFVSYSTEKTIKEINRRQGTI